MIDMTLKDCVRGVVRRVQPFALPTSAAALLLALGACSVNDALSVNDPDVVSASGTATASALPVVLAGAMGDFHVAYGGPIDGNETTGQIGYGGLLADELRSSDTFDTRNEIDQRNIRLTNASNETMFVRLSQARASADRASLRYNTFARDSSGHSLVLSLGGYTRILFAEDYCSGVPFSTLTDNTQLIFGDPETTSQILQDAIAKFDSAATIGGATSDQLNLAAVGKARALLDLGQYADAAAAVASVPTNFAYMDLSSANTNREGNGVYWFFYGIPRMTIPDSEGISGLNYISAKDPRVPVQVTKNVGEDGSTLSNLEGKYTARSSPTPIATGIEAPA